MTLILPNFEIEEEKGGVVAGIDEAGRGPLAGPVVAACVILNKDSYPCNLNDSKKLNKKTRIKIFSELKETVKFGIGIVDEKIIDEINILNATKMAMKLAFDDLVNKYKIVPDFVLVDGNFTPNINTKAEFVIKGDQKSLSISAASVIAKETRDEIMFGLDRQFPQYDWKNNQAYPTKFHLEKIKEIGICKYHRKSFSPIKDFIKI